MAGAYLDSRPVAKTLSQLVSVVDECVMRAKSASRAVGWDLAAQAPTGPEHPASTGSVAIARPGQGDLGAPPELVGLHEAVQALLGLPVLGLLTRRPVR